MLRSVILLLIVLLPSSIYGQSHVDSVLSVTSTKVDGIKYQAILFASGFFKLKGKQGKTLFNSKNSDGYCTGGEYCEFRFVDFNGDGYKDLFIDYLTNIPGVSDVLMYDPPHKRFKMIEGFSRFMDAHRISGTPFYYSYHRSGCADVDWDSDLFIIKNFKSVKIGNIAGRECHNRDERDGIYISIIKNGKEKRIKTLPIQTIYDYKNYKWGFIAAYWTKHYRYFSLKK